MQTRIIAVGKPALDWARGAVADYFQRLTRYTKTSIEYLKESGAAANSGRLLKASAGCRRIVMDQRGKLLRTEGARQAWDRWEGDSNVKAVAFLIGGADGHTDELRAKADEVWALSPLTLQHELALVVLLEQLYRIQTIKRGEPYHR
jgi:23S rRNA (pseudouridine1915-N3)-methyltransferase